MASWGIRLIFVDISGLSKFKVGGSIFVCSDLKEKTASTAPAFNLNFGSEINSYTLTDYGGTNNSLFQLYYQNYITRVFNTRTRIFKYKAILPLKFLLTYSLADKVFVNGRAFTINKITTKLQTGESSLELLNEPT